MDTGSGAPDGRAPAQHGGAAEPGSSRRRAGELSGLVLEVLRTLAEAGAGPLAYTTVVTILSRLHAQGLTDRFRAGRAYAYLAVADAQLAARRMRRVLDAEDDRAAVLASFTAGLTARDERVLRDLLGPGLLPGDAGDDAGTDG